MIDVDLGIEEIKRSNKIAFNFRDRERSRDRSRSRDRKRRSESRLD